MFTQRLLTDMHSINAQVARFPSSRYMGSKHAILPFIYDVMKELDFTTALDACSGSGAMSYLLKSMGKAVTSNDSLHFCYHTAQACVANNTELLLPEEVAQLLSPHPAPRDFIARTFQGLYFTDAENQWLDNVMSHILDMQAPFKQSIAIAALVRACLRRRPRGIFTYTGLRYDDGRRDLHISLEQHFTEAVDLLNAAVFDNGHTNAAFTYDIFQFPEDMHFDLVYIDPPYVSPHSDNDYSRRYHFVEGLARYWEGLDILGDTLTKKFPRIRSRFDSKQTVEEAFRALFERFQDSIIVVSYSSNGIPSQEQLYDMLAEYKKDVFFRECDHRYSFGTHSHKVHDNQNEVKEFLFVGK